MAKISGFKGVFTGLSNNEAWQRVYEYGKNYMPIREKRIHKAYMKIFRPKTKVIRDGVLQKVKTDYIVPGDCVIIEEGQFVPVDGKILEKHDLELVNNLDSANKDFVYQGAKVLTGKAVIEAVKTSDATYTAEKVKQIDNYNKKKNRFERKMKKWIWGVSIVTLIFSIFAFVFTMVAFTDLEILNRILLSFGSAAFLMVMGIPFGLVSTMAKCLIRPCKILKSCGLKVKRLFSLPEVEKVTMLCLDDEFLEGEHSKRIERLYEVGISIAVLTEKKLNEVADKVISVGICNGEIAVITKNELDILDDEAFDKAICDNFVFCELDRAMKEKIIGRFEKLGIRCMVSGYGLEDIATIENADIGITRNNEKNSLDYELADATLLSYNFGAIYEFIRQSFIFSCNLKNYIYHIIIFQFPIMMFVLIMLINHVNLNELWWQALLMTIVIIPCAMFTISKDYTKSRLIDLKEDKDKFMKRTIICLFVAITIVAFVVFCEFVSVKLGMEKLNSVNISFLTIAILIAGIAIVERIKFPYKGKMNLRGIAKTENDNNSSVVLKNKKTEEKSTLKKEKPVKFRPAKKEKKDIGNEML